MNLAVITSCNNNVEPIRSSHLDLQARIHTSADTIVTDYCVHVSQQSCFLVLHTPIIVLLSVLSFVSAIPVDHFKPLYAQVSNIKLYQELTCLLARLDIVLNPVHYDRMIITVE